MKQVLGMIGAAVLLCAPALAGPAVYHFNSGAEGWTANSTDSGLDNFDASGGALSFDYVTPGVVFDPILVSPGDLDLDAGRHHWFRIDIEIETPAPVGPQTIQVFFAASNGAFTEAASRTISVTPNTGLQSIIFDMAPPQPGRDPFTGTIANFRVDPGNLEADLVGGSARIEVIALTNDADFDGIVDDVEIALFGDRDTADATSDFDGDGIPDAKEIALGLDPLVDEGISLPAGGAFAGILALGALGLFHLRRRK